MQIREIFEPGQGGNLIAIYFPKKVTKPLIHYDVHDVLAIQVEGHKHWQIFPEGIEYPINHPIFLVEAMNLAQERPTYLRLYL